MESYFNPPIQTYKLLMKQQLVDGKEKKSGSGELLEMSGAIWPSNNLVSSGQSFKSLGDL
jgi:hypothetical protein